MCAIAGVVGGEFCLRDSLINKLLVSMVHRGPDETGIFSSDNKPISIGMNRLSITGIHDFNHCPFVSDGLVLSFNGEIYNFRELRSLLQSEKGEVFETQTDTEVLLKLWKHYGERCLDKLNGMFAFAIYEVEKNLLYLVRDIAGQKPLYYYKGDKQQIIFASEAKAIYRALPNLEFVDGEDLRFYEAFQHNLTGSLFKGLNQVAAASFIKVDCESHDFEVKSYWEPSFEVLSNDDQVIRGEQFGYLLSESVKRITSCEVPYGLYLSKGVDSQVINALGSFDKTYYFDRDEDWGEDFYKNFSKISQILDFPVGSLSSYPLYKLAEKASLNGVKVVVSGEGSDEILGGYVRYLPISNLDDVYNNFPSYQRLFNKALGSRELQFAKISCRNDDVDFVMHLIEECRAKTSDMLTCMQYFDFKYVLPSLLQMGDRMASNFSLENRCPFLDKDLIEYAFSLPKIDKINQHNQKAILRNMAHKLGVKTEKEKTGLTIKFNVYMHRNDWNRDNYFSNLNYEWLLGVRS